MLRPGVVALAVVIAVLATAGPRTSYGYGDNLTSGQWLFPGQQLVSASGGFRFAMQTDGNLVLYYTGRGQPGVVERALWWSGTYGQSVNGVIMQGDGNLVIYSPSGTPLWASNTYGHPGAYLLVQDDGNAVIYAFGGAFWSTGTYNARNTQSFGAGDCWRPGTPLSCRNTWSGRNTFIYFRAIDQFSGEKPGWLTGVNRGVSAWNNSPGPQFYSFTPRRNDTWNYIKIASSYQQGLGDSQTAGIAQNCNWSIPGGPCFIDSRPMMTVWSEIYINRDFYANSVLGPALDASLQHVIAHESGHAMMLAHNPLDPNAIMYNSTDPRTQFPNANDIGANPDCSAGGFGIRCIYGSW